MSTKIVQFSVPECRRHLTLTATRTSPGFYLWSDIKYKCSSSTCNETIPLKLENDRHQVTPSWQTHFLLCQVCYYSGIIIILPSRYKLQLKFIQFNNPQIIGNRSLMQLLSDYVFSVEGNNYCGIKEKLAVVFIDLSFSSLKLSLNDIMHLVSADDN